MCTRARVCVCVWGMHVGAHMYGCRCDAYRHRSVMCSECAVLCVCAFVCTWWAVCRGRGCVRVCVYARVRVCAHVHVGVCMCGGGMVGRERMGGRCVCGGGGVSGWAGVLAHVHMCVRTTVPVRLCVRVREGSCVCERMCVRVGVRESVGV